MLFDGNFQGFVDGVVHFPKADQAGEFDDLSRAQMVLKLIQDFIGHAASIFGGGLDEGKASGFECVLGLERSL